MELYAFEGLRYAQDEEEAGPLAAPPYDQINDAARDSFHARSPRHFVHLTRPAAPAEEDAYRHAAALHERWLADGSVVRDPRPAVYPYVIALAGGGRRLGVMALVGFDDPAVIRPHEETLAKPLADRTALLAAMRVDLEPALLLAEDDGRLEELIAADVSGRPPLVDHLDADGHHHLVYRVDDPARIRLYQQAVAARPAAIADGHHRYKVGQQYARDHAAAHGEAAAAKLSVVTSMTSPALVIDPIHRALRLPADRDRLAGLAPGGRVPFHPVPPRSAPPAPPAPAPAAPAAPEDAATGPSPGAQLAAAVAAAPQPALGVWVRGGEPEIWRFDVPGSGAGSGAGAGAGAGVRAGSAAGAGHEAGETAPSAPLAVEIFQRQVLPALGLPPEAATDGTVVYRANPEELYEQVAGGELGTGFWLPPMLPADFAAAIARGDLLPPKSTRFLPKVMSGLVWADHRSRLL
jgi:uncharacterized protein (DUF1015 family)